jgi:N-acyl-D-aspartate/D-glutamate deacylase
MQTLRNAPKAINLASYLPLNALLIYVMGVDEAKRRMATAEELVTMRDMLNRALDAGACGISFSHMGEGNTHSDSDGSAMPTDVMAIDIAYELCDVLRARDQGVIQTLTEFPGLPDIAQRRDIVKEVAKRSQRPTIHTLCVPVDRAPDAHRSILNWLDALEREGVNNVVTQALLGRKWAEIRAPDWTTWDGGGPLFREYSSSGDWNAKVRKARDQDWRNRLRQGYSPDLLMGSGGPLESYTLRNSHGHPRFESGEGKKIGEIAAKHGMQVTDVFFDLVADTNGQADFVITEGVSSDPNKAAEILVHPRAMPGTSDGGAHAMAVNGGHYPTELIAWVVREHNLLSLEQLHFKLSNHTARFMGFRNRGILLEGYAADLMIYNYDAIDFDLHHLETHFDPPDGSYRRLSRPRGLHWVVVNGRPILKDTKGTGARPGQLISNGGSTLDEALFMPHHQQAAE